MEHWPPALIILAIPVAMLWWDMWYWKTIRFTSKRFALRAAFYLVTAICIASRIYVSLEGPAWLAMIVSAFIGTTIVAAILFIEITLKHFAEGAARAQVARESAEAESIQIPINDSPPRTTKKPKKPWPRLHPKQRFHSKRYF
jgi:hypothetical protein